MSWTKVFKIGPSKNCGRQPFHFKFHFKYFKGCLPQILLGPFLNTLTHIFHQKKVLKEYEKYFLFTEKSLFVLEIFKFLYFPLPSFSHVGHYWIYTITWLKINPKVHDVIMCLNRNLKANCLTPWEVKVWYLNLVHWYTSKIILFK